VATQGRIFQNDGHIFLCAAGLLVKVPSKEYHEKMHQWTAGRMVAPLVFTDNGIRCVLTAPAGGGDVLVELERMTT
jgi:hypothetical protein